MFHLLQSFPELKTRDWAALARLERAMRARWKDEFRRMDLTAICIVVGGCIAGIVIMLTSLVAGANPGNGLAVTGPCLLLVSGPILLPLSLYLAVRWRERRLRRFVTSLIDRRACLACGYSLAGLPLVDQVPKCPECGVDRSY